MPRLTDDEADDIIGQLKKQNDKLENRLSDAVRMIEYLLPYVREKARESGNAAMLVANAVELGRECTCFVSGVDIVNTIIDKAIHDRKLNKHRKDASHAETN